jgi:hypothetical protein
MQSARGESDEIIVVMDSTQWEGEIGSLIRETFRDPMQGLPQDEAKFSINKASPLRLNSVLKSATNMIFVMTLDSKTRESAAIRNYFTDQSLKIIRDDSSRFMLTKQDEFARGQTVLYLFSNSEEQLIEKLKSSKDRLQSYFEARALQSIKESLFKSRNTEAEKAIKEELDVDIKIPFGWEVAKQLPNFAWVRMMDVDMEQNVFIYKEPYTSEKVFENVAYFRDQITEKYLRDSEKNEIYITRQMRDDLNTVFFDQVSFNDMYGVEQRGLWKISDNSAGGPYVSYTFVDEETQTLYYIEGYVYAPGGRKKKLVRETEAILSSFKLAK